MTNKNKEKIIKGIHNRGRRYLKAYHSDLKLDEEFILEKWDGKEKIIWLVREFGTDIGFYDDLKNENSWIRSCLLYSNKHSYEITEKGIKKVDYKKLVEKIK